MDLLWKTSNAMIRKQIYEKATAAARVMDEENELPDMEENELPNVEENPLPKTFMLPTNPASFLKYKQRHCSSQPYQYSPKKNKRLVNVAAIQSQLRSGCCRNTCVQELTSTEVLKVRQLYAAGNEQSRTQLLIAFIKTNYDGHKPPGQQYFFKGQPMCATAVQILYGCGKAKLAGAH